MLMSPCFPQQASQYYYRVDRREIYFLKFIVEAYEGLAMMRTLEASRGIVVLHVAPGCEEELCRLLDSLGHDMLIEPLASPPEDLCRRAARRPQGVGSETEGDRS
jgi:hypothetical protein